MAAYAALVSVMHIIDDLQLHPHPPISLHIGQVESLTAKVSFLQEFLEGYNPDLGYNTEADPLESRIADAAYAAEAVIESHIVDQLTNDGEKINSEGLREALEKVLQDMASIEKEIEGSVGVQDELHRNSTPPDSLRSSSSSIAQTSSVVGADDALLEMKYKLTDDRRDLQIIPIVGMGGTGKTTLAINIYQDRLVNEHFDICAWATISQEYSTKEILIQLLCQLNEIVDGHLKGDKRLRQLDKIDDDEFGQKLYKHLYDRKYLIIMDDMWSIEAWDGVRRFFPNNGNGSRVVITTRLLNLASMLSSNSNSLEMELLDEVNSWKLLSKTVFGKNGCPLELEEIGKRIGKSCKGLPLSIIVIGGVLAKSKHTREFWKHIEENLNSIVNLEDGERCLKILHMSYRQLPIYLKPCFLYMGIFPEDEVILISRLTKLWVAEGFLKPISGKSPEEIGRVYLKDLADRNLVLIHKTGIRGNIKECKIHDLLRDFCLREAKKKGFVPSQNLMLKSLADLEENMHQLVNTRFLAFSRYFLSSIWLFWNLQTLIIVDGVVAAPTCIWCIPHIRHIQIKQLYLPDPPKGQDSIVLENLQTMGTIVNFKCNEQVVKRIPNIKKLQISYQEEVGVDDDRYCLTNLVCLDKLESLTCSFFRDMNPNETINFPHWLTKLSLNIFNQYWEDILDEIGMLRFLQKLTLEYGYFKEGHWKTTEGHFCSLKFLVVRHSDGLRLWTTESSHFPCLEHLLLFQVEKLEEIPLDFAEISTLRVIDVKCCSNSVVASAKRIVEEQEELYGEEAALQVHVALLGKNETLEILASPNFCLSQY